MLEKNGRQTVISTVMTKKIVLIIQALSDVALEDLGGLTPLQKAETPTLDGMAKSGGAFRIIPPEAGGEKTALLSLLAGRSDVPTLARGPLEAYALGYALTPLQTAFSLRFMSSGQGVVVSVDDALLAEEECRALCRELNRELGAEGCHFFPLDKARALCIVENSVLGDVEMGLGFNPISALGKQWMDLLPRRGKRSPLETLMEQAASVLEAHEINQLRYDLEECPVNSLLLFEGGSQEPLAGLATEEMEKTVLLHSRCPASYGLAKRLGIPFWNIPKQLERFDDLRYFQEQLPPVLEKVDTIVLEIPYLADATYKGDLLEKIKTLEWIDRRFIPHLLNMPADLWIFPLKNVDIRSGRAKAGSVPAVTTCAIGPSQSCFSESVTWTSPVPLAELWLSCKKK